MNRQTKTPTYTCIIVDDNPAVTNSLFKVITTKFDNISILGNADCVCDAVKLINDTLPDLIFLDIELPDGNGFDILNTIDCKPSVIFITSYTDFAIKAFQFAALHYIIKPFDTESIELGIQRFFKEHPSNSTNTQIQVLNHNQNNSDKHIALPTKNCIEVICIRDIIYLESVRNYIIFYLKDERQIVVTSSLNDFTDLLEPYDFFRIHQSYIINLHEIRRYTRGRGGYVKLSNGIELDVSTRRKQAFIAQLSLL